MPDAAGWHSEAFILDGQLVRWHYCHGATRDTLVVDTEKAKAEHEARCFGRQLLEADRRRAEGKQRRTAALEQARLM